MREKNGRRGERKRQRGNQETERRRRGNGVERGREKKDKREGKERRRKRVMSNLVATSNIYLFQASRFSLTLASMTTS